MENLAWKVWKIFIERCSVSYDNNSGQQCLWDFFYCWQNAIPYNLTQYIFMRHTAQRIYFIQWPTYFLFFFFKLFVEIRYHMWTMEMTIVIINLWGLSFRKIKIGHEQCQRNFSVKNKIYSQFWAKY